MFLLERLWREIPLKCCAIFPNSLGMHVPFLNLKAAHDALRSEITAAIHEVIDSSAFAGGPFVARFEQEFAAYCGAKHAIGLGHGTEALWAVLLAKGIGP